MYFVKNDESLGLVHIKCDCGKITTYPQDYFSVINEKFCVPQKELKCECGKVYEKPILKENYLELEHGSKSTQIMRFIFAIIAFTAIIFIVVSGIFEIFKIANDDNSYRESEMSAFENQLNKDPNSWSAEERERYQDFSDWTEKEQLKEDKINRRS